MKSKYSAFLPALAMGILVPYLMLGIAGTFVPHEEPLPQIEPQTTGATTLSVAETEKVISVLVDGTRTQMDLEDYLIGVVLGEMPASFEPEALKAQAVVARTYTLRRAETGTKHDNAAVCTSPDCCQAYTDPARYLNSGGKQASVDKVTDAVQSTQGMVLTYGGNLIEATYFSSSGGRTEDALAVWGSDLPYLQATDSPEDAYVDKYMDTVTMSAKEFQKALGITLKGRCESWIESVSYTNGGGVETMVIGGESYKGTELRSLLGLKSTAFTVTMAGDSITITTRGYGHRVGMSQYGAEAMAVAGSTFDQILKHYYQGANLEEYVDNKGIFG